MYRKIQIDNDDENKTMMMGQAPAGKQTDDSIIESIIESGVDLKDSQVGEECLELLKLRYSDVYKHTEEYNKETDCYCVISVESCCRDWRGRIWILARKGAAVWKCESAKVVYYCECVKNT